MRLPDWCRLAATDTARTVLLTAMAAGSPRHGCWLNAAGHKFCSRCIQLVRHLDRPICGCAIPARVPKISSWACSDTAVGSTKRSLQYMCAILSSHDKLSQACPCLLMQAQREVMQVAVVLMSSFSLRSMQPIQFLGHARHKSISAKSIQVQKGRNVLPLLTSPG